MCEGHVGGGHVVAGCSERILGRVFSDTFQKGSDVKKTKSRLGDLSNYGDIGQLKPACK